MGGVYRGAYLTIAAENASGDEEGFLKPRAPVSSSLEVIFKTGHTSPSSIFGVNTSKTTSLHIPQMTIRSAPAPGPYKRTFCPEGGSGSLKVESFGVARNTH
jgi:hypothetical protein